MPWICTLGSQSGDLCKHFTCYKSLVNVSLLSNLTLSNNVPSEGIIQNKPELQFCKDLGEMHACCVNTCAESFISISLLKMHLKYVHKYSDTYLETFMIGQGSESEGGKRYTVHKQGFRTVSDGTTKLYICEFPNCKVTRSKKHAMFEHVRYSHRTSIQNFCTFCYAGFDNIEALNQHKSLVHYKKSQFHSIEESHQDQNNPQIFNKGSFVRAYEPNKYVQVDQIFNQGTIQELEQLLDNLASHSGSVYVKVSLVVMAGEQDSEGNIVNIQQRDIYTPNKFEIIANSPNTVSTIMKMCQGLRFATEELENTIGSGFTILSIDGLKIDYYRKRGLRGAKWISSASLSHKNSILNIRNIDDRCLLYCIAAHLHPLSSKVSKKIKEDPDSYKSHLCEFNIDNMSFPIVGKDKLEEFVEQNSHLDFDLSIYKIFGNDVYPIFSSKKENKQRKNQIKLLEIEGYIQATDKCPEPHFTSHYLLIIDNDAFLRKHYTDKKGRIYNNKKNVCPSCEKFSTRDKDVMKKHRKGCDITKTGQQFKTADPGKTLKFSRTTAAFAPPLVGMADFETSITKTSVCQPCKNLYHPHLSSEQMKMMVCYHTQKCSKPECENKNSGCEHKSTLIKKDLNSIAHFGILLDRNSNIFDEKVTYGFECAEKYLQHLLDIEQEVTSYIAKNIPCKPLTHHQKTLYKTQRKCEYAF